MLEWACIKDMNLDENGDVKGLLFSMKKKELHFLKGN